LGAQSAERRAQSADVFGFLVFGFCRKVVFPTDPKSPLEKVR
jgi:hypothetical protein